MTPISFDKVCRFCLKTNGVRSIYMVNGNLENQKKKTEFEFKETVEKWLKEDKKKCEFCDCPFIEVSNIEIGDYKLYDFDRLVNDCKQKDGELFLWNITKSSKNTVELKVGGKTAHDPLFIR